MMRNGNSRLMVVLGLGCATALAACSVNDRVEKNPVGFVRDKSQSPRARVMAVDYISQHRTDPGAARINPQAAYKEIAWSGGEPPVVRAAVVEALLNDPDPAVVDDAKTMAKLLLPREPSREVVVVICRAAGEKGWTDFVPSIVRSYSRPIPGANENERAERIALEKLGGGKSVDEIAFEVFLHPPKMPATDGVDWTMRCRTDAWDLLARLDSDGSIRGRLLSTADAASGGNDPLLAAIAQCRRDLRAIPITGDELNWLVSLRRQDKKENAAWWQEATSAVARTSAAPGDLRLRHAEPIRWCAANKPDWLHASRAELLGTLAARTKGRQTNRRSLKDGPTEGPTPSELLERREAELSWGDVLAILVIDEALRGGQVAPTLFSQTLADRADTSTEYGGLLSWKRTGGAEVATVTLFPPRPTQRLGDERFVASDDMIAGGDLSLAHYHFHVQKEKNSEYAGPSGGDIEYATRHGRSCLVFTSINASTLGVDWYGPGGTVVDLGELTNK